MRCRFCEGILLPEEYYDNTIARHVLLLKCKSCGRPFASRLQFVQAAALLPDGVVAGVLERTEKRRKQEEPMAESKKCSCGCGKTAHYKGYANSCFKRIHGKSVSEDSGIKFVRTPKKAANAGGGAL